MTTEATVYIVDDDQAVRESLQFLMTSIGLQAETFESAQSFLEVYHPQIHGCLILDIRMPGMGGLELQEHLNRIGANLPVIIITGHGDVPMAVRALKAGAFDFVEKPFNDQVLLDRVQEAIQKDSWQHHAQASLAEIEARLQRLTPREREVMNEVVDGLSNREISAKLNVSTKTVEAHRARVMEKLQVRTLPDLVRLVVEYRSRTVSV